MGSRKEEEKNEKIIRGLMKLPPNRRCINCNSMGQQYVCITFWTFVCVTCSGIHREFTHRVKSVSMAKFTSQEVDALQNGGNQRAREIYLNSWDFQRQRLPDNSNVDKIREFIRNVYVDRRYAGVKRSEKPPRDPQSPRIEEDDTRRASSYHSYSQSPPYDNQYEDRRYGKQAFALTRKLGSDKVRYEGKMSSIIYSPGRFSEHAFDERFANEGSGRRISDFSVSSAGDQFKSDVQSPVFHKDIGFSSPSYQRSGTNSHEDVWSQTRSTVLETNAKRDADESHRPQITTSLQSTDSNFSSLKSYTGGVVDFFSEPVQASGYLQNKADGAPHPSAPTRSVNPSLNENQPTRTSQPPSIDFFADLGQQPSTETSAATSHVSLVDLFQSSVLTDAPSFNQNQPRQTFQPSSIDFFVDNSQQPSTKNSIAPSQAPPQAPSVNLYQSFVLSAAPSFKENHPTQTSQTQSIDFFSDLSLQPFTATSDENSVKFSVPKNEGWAAFDMPQSTLSTAQVGIPVAVPSSVGPLQERFDPFSNFNSNMQLPSVEISSVSAPPSSVTSNLWHDGLWSVEEQAPNIATITEPWNAFESSGTHLPVDAFSEGLQLHKFPSTDNQFSVSRVSEFGDGSNKGGIQVIASVGGFGNHDITSHTSASPNLPPTPPLMGDMQSNGIGSKSTNPFDYPYDFDVEHNNMFLDMSSLQAALPDSPLPATFGSGIAEPWHPQNTVTSYISSSGQGGLSFLTAQPLSSQIQNVQTQEPVASFGGNPFA
ncbi:putative Arf GTPase activating protein [Lupinus albus]|uniref:Putative Arf GTPase activating protein n=1 Tax=Lupinus albus TaxID=3870 RepID=A0A6A4QG77_LUPAL|nr:putative Arf GTPase activating protein [Lupinus albus]